MPPSAAVEGVELRAVRGKIAISRMRTEAKG
jgi:hypothetical protein